MSGTLLALLILAILFILVGVAAGAVILIKVKKTAKEKAKANKKLPDWAMEKRLSTEIKNKFHCIKCGHKENEINSVSTPSKGLASFFNFDSQKLFQVYCRKCGYSQFFNKTFLMAAYKNDFYVSLLQDFEGDMRKKFKNEYEEADHKHKNFKCVYCGNTEKNIDLLGTTGKGVSKLIDYHENDFLTATCKTCGYMEFYRS